MKDSFEVEHYNKYSEFYFVFKCGKEWTNGQNENMNRIGKITRLMGVLFIYFENWSRKESFCELGLMFLCLNIINFLSTWEEKPILGNENEKYSKIYLEVSLSRLNLFGTTTIKRILEIFFFKIWNASTISQQFLVFKYFYIK